MSVLLRSVQQLIAKALVKGSKILDNNYYFHFFDSKGWEKIGK